MHLNILYAVDRLQVLHHLLRDIGTAYGIQWQLHRKQTICIAAESLSVEKVAPATDDLSQNQPDTCSVCHQPEILFFYFYIYIKCNYCRDHTAEYRQSAFPEIQNVDQIVFVLIPGKDNIIRSRPDQCDRDRIECHIKILIRILVCFLRHPHGNAQTQNHSACDDHTVIGNLKATDADRLSDI